MFYLLIQYLMSWESESNRREKVSRPIYLSRSCFHVGFERQPQQSDRFRERIQPANAETITEEIERTVRAKTGSESGLPFTIRISDSPPIRSFGSVKAGSRLLYLKPARFNLSFSSLQV
ncbi:hypothetical protein MA16_Dca015656 [Dendrobium catenatum]|uniref:Uncharacterized protein n=1 Tax=Dendrobium catenatum TaxID=906689 RepID=A0A2I0WZW0_9ASPA|nr:hypothetical protein MA16_Dca015656 [Dendrobium catenatum]